MKDPKAQQWLTKADGLATRLKQARGERSGLSLAGELGWASSKITRIEQGAQVPSASDIALWVSHTGGDATQVKELQGLLAEFVSMRGVFQQRAKRPDEPVHTDASALVAAATLIRTYSTWAVPPIVQLPEYARAVLEEQLRVDAGLVDDLDSVVAARIRRQTLLYDTTRRFEMILDEAVLRRRHGGVDVLRAQLDRLLALTDMKTVRFGIVPFDADIAVPPVHSFAIYDEQVFIELLTGDEPAVTFDPELYASALARYWAAAATGEGARRLILAAISVLSAG